ncbi:MAG: helix-turn-helix transcriptional regulator [Clostridiaceae bacterium]|nr:helix-turn-helix transcriptional regulator [Clostridiaceae bacterium]
MRQWLKDLRQKMALSQSEVATKIGITQQQYSFIENGNRTPSVETAQAIANVLGFPWTRFFEPDTQEEKPDRP